MESRKSLFISDDAQVEELINRRRRQILVSSIAYYKYNHSFISDYQWSEWAKELVGISKARPDIAARCCYAKEFEDFEGSTGFDLPLNDPDMDKVTRRMMTYEVLKKMIDTKKKKEGIY